MPAPSPVAPEFKPGTVGPHYELRTYTYHGGELPVIQALREEGDERMRVMETPQALAVATMAIQLDPTAAWGHKMAAYALQNLFRPAEARAHAEAALRLQPDDPEARTLLNTLGAPPAPGR